MNKKVILNNAIRESIVNHVDICGASDTRNIISLYAKQYNTTKQRISGNISALVCSGSMSILHNRPHSMIY